nr:pentatricopeptide repeat-containing protein [Fagopyrum tataricum]
MRRYGLSSFRKRSCTDATGLFCQKAFPGQLKASSLYTTLQTFVSDIDEDGLSKVKDGVCEGWGFFDGDGIPQYHKLLLRCVELCQVREGKIVHAHFLKSQFKENVVIQNSLLNMYARCGSLNEARKQFDAMPSRDTVSFTMMICAASVNGSPTEAIALFPSMLSLGLKPNHFTLSSLLKVCGVIPNMKDGIQLHAICFKYGLDGYVFVGTSLVDMYARCGCMSEAQVLFEGLTSKNDVSWNAMIAGYARQGGKALDLFREMQRIGLKSTHFTYSSIFNACASTGAFEQGKWVHAHMIKSGVKLVSFVGHTMLDMYAKAGSIKDADKVFDRLLEKDVVSWNSILTGYAQHGLGKETTKKFERMLKIGIKPNSITFLSVLTACSHSGLLEQGQYYFGLMRKYNIEPKPEHCVAIVDLLGRAGLFDRVEMFLREMPIKPTAAIWGAVMNACRMHKNIELGAYAAKQLFVLGQHDCGPYVILANIYALAGKWHKVAKVRKMMRKIGVKKVPGFSWVEIENTVHVFVANDETHPQKEEIHRMWGEISRKIKEIGYVPDTSHVLLNVDEKEREAKLQYHSEKLALAFALLNTPPGSTIIIRKNIRVCGDCHSAIKFASKVFTREIIVRDTNRYHHFRDGSCSCGDYW